MAEYKYKALGWKDDDIASLNVVGGTADNQVELQITKQGAGGTIDGPAIIGKDGITINKVADSQKIEISGSGLVKHYYSIGSTKAYVVGPNNNDDTIIISSGATNAGTTLMLRAGDGSSEVAMPVNPVDLSITNKKYVDDNYVKKDKTPAKVVYGHNSDLSKQMFYVSENNGNPNWLVKYSGDDKAGATEPQGMGRICSREPTQPYQLANKKYVDEAVAGSRATVDGTSIVKDTDGKIQLNQEYIKYLDNQLYQPPAISVFTMLDAAGAALPTSNELGTTLRVAAFNHKETNIKNIQGDNVELHINNAAAATTSTAKKDVATKVTLTTAQSITSSTKFTLKGTNTKGAAFSRDYQVNFYRYAYTATTDATTAPTSGATQQAAVSTFASNGNTFNYTKGAYIYFYTDNTGKKVQTNVLGQWADVDTTDMGKVTLTQSNGATHEYTCYRIGPFIETGSAKYRV